MLPEHVEILKRLFAEQTYEEKPVLDEQQVMENEAILKHAIHDHLVIEIKYFKNHDFQIVKGKITNINNHYLWIAQHKICLEDVIAIHYV